MPTTPIEFTDELLLQKPFLLFVGRKKALIDKPSRFEIKRTHLQSQSEESLTVDFISPRPVSQAFSLFIDDHLFSVTHPTGKRRWSVRITKPRKLPGFVEIHLVKKYTSLAA